MVDIIVENIFILFSSTDHNSSAVANETRRSCLLIKNEGYEAFLIRPYSTVVEFHIVVYDAMVDFIDENNFALFLSMTTNNDAVAIGMLISLVLIEI